MRILSGLTLIVLAALAVLAYFSLFIVKQTRQAVVLEFGELVRVVNAHPKENNAGLYTKMPWYDVIYFDKRILDLDARPLEAVTAGKVPLIIDAFGRYQINNPLKLFQSVRNVSGANRRLESILEKSLRGVLGASTYLEIVRDKRELMMSRILTEMNQTAESIGVKFIDVRIKRADLPADNSKKVFERMISERVRVAKKIRAEGNEQAQIIRAKTDREVIEIKAEANRRASITRGEGDAERNRIYAAAFGKDPDFFAFYRSMEAYEKGLKGSNTRMLLSPDSEFFRYFNQASGKR
ncbi:MAG: protease modulator HflC [Hyphomicrobiaceae bacterium]|nr:protease modulator HflC [Hyphomicrobiaceae bacterium]